MIQLKELVKQFGFHIALRGINLHVSEGEFVTLVGPNGAGKSTLLRIVATLLKPTSGEALVGGWPLGTHADKVRKHIGLISHQSMLYDDLNAAENLAFFARLYGLTNVQERVEQSLRGVGLLARQRDAVGTFSRGMVQRLAIARATLHEPDILLLDEPYTGLDRDASTLLDSLLTQESEKGRTILMITHDLLHGVDICDRVAVLARGKIVGEVASSAMQGNEWLSYYADLTKPKRKGKRRGKSP